MLRSPSLALIRPDTPRILRYWRETDFGPWWQRLGGHFVYFADDVQVWREVLEDDDFL
jgi:hypothetical protein